MLNEIYVERIAQISEVRLASDGAVVIRLDLYVISCAQGVSPFPEEIQAGEFRIGVDQLLEWRSIAGCDYALTGFLLVGVTLKSEGVVIAAIPIHPKSALAG